MEAVETLKQMEAMGQPSCWWVLMPWKVAATKALKEDLDGHSQVLRQLLTCKND
jgi:hypothetical protein